MYNDSFEWYFQDQETTQQHTGFDCGEEFFTFSVTTFKEVASCELFMLQLQAELQTLCIQFLFHMNKEDPNSTQYV